MREGDGKLPRSEHPPQSEQPPDTRLDSWKEISEYLRRTVRTVQRWEQTEGLPVHRIAHDKRSTVFAYRTELDAWWQSRQATKSGRLILPPPSDGTGAAAKAKLNLVPRWGSQLVWVLILALAVVTAAVMLVRI